MRWTNTAMQNGYHYSFEELKGASAQIGALSADEWVATLEKAKDLAISLDMASQSNDDDFTDLASSAPSPSSIGANHSNGQDSSSYDMRNQLSKSQQGLDDPALKRHRFSKRQSRNGFGAAF